MLYKIEIVGIIESDLTKEKLNGKLDLGLLKYDVNEITNGDEQSISQKDIYILEYEEFTISEINS